MRPNVQSPADLVTFTKETFNGKDKIYPTSNKNLKLKVIY